MCVCVCVCGGGGGGGGGGEGGDSVYIPNTSILAPSSSLLYGLNMRMNARKNVLLLRI